MLESRDKEEGSGWCESFVASLESIYPDFESELESPNGQDYYLVIHIKSAKAGSANMDFDPFSGSWSIGQFADDRLASFTVSPRKRIAPLGEDDFALQLEVENPTQAAEFLDFFSNAKLNCRKKFDPVERTLDRIFSGYYVKVWVDNHPKLLSLDHPAGRDVFTDNFTAYLKYGLSGDINKIVDLGGALWTHVCRENEKNLRGLALEPVAMDDLILSCEGLWMVAEDECRSKPEDYLEDFPRVFLRINRKEASNLFCSEYFRFTEEGRKALQECFFSWESLDQVKEKLRCVSLNIPSSKNSQIRYGIEMRTTRFAFENRFHELSEQTEPAENALYLLRKRLHCIQSLYGAYLQDVEVIQSPLPYFLEKPFRRFLKADAGTDRIRHGVHYLSIIVKVVVLLPLEELIQQRMEENGNQTQSFDEIIDSISTKPPTDGNWAAHFRRVNATGVDRLVVFKSLVEKHSTVHTRIETLINMRNKWIHSEIANPVFSREFENRLWVDLNGITEKLREGLRGLDFLVPKHVKFDGTSNLLTAKRVMGYDAEFQTIETPVSEENIRSFPIDQLIARRNGKSVILRRYFECIDRHVESIDIRVFNKVVGGKPLYVSIDGSMDSVS